MKKPLFIVLVLSVGLLALAGAVFAQERKTGETDATRLQQLFVDAGRAYDQGNEDEAISLYRKILDEGYVSAELLFNLGNAYFKRGDAGMAVLSYRRAWHLAPRDPDILANLRFALQSTGATGPFVNAAGRFFLELGRAEWIALAVAFFWLGSAGLALVILFPGRRAVTARLTGALAVLLVVSLSGAASWHLLDRYPEAVVLRPGQQALFAPLEGSTAHFALPQGSIVRVLETSGEWTKVASGKQTGWIPSSACAAVYPWRAGAVR